MRYLLHGGPSYQFIGEPDSDRRGQKDRQLLPIGQQSNGPSSDRRQNRIVDGETLLLHILFFSLCPSFELRQVLRLKAPRHFLFCVRLVQVTMSQGSSTKKNALRATVSSESFWSILIAADLDVLQGFLLYSQRVPNGPLKSSRESFSIPYRQYWGLRGGLEGQPSFSSSPLLGKNIGVVRVKPCSSVVQD